MTEEKSQTRLRYPSPFLFGLVTGSTLVALTRTGTMEPLSARPFSYLRVGLFFAVTLSWWDHARRVAMEDVMRAEQKQAYFKMTKAINSGVRFGEEDEIANLTEYLATSTIRH